MKYDTLLYDVTDGVATVRLNRPEKMNALNTRMRAELTDAMKRAASEARVVVLTGEGVSFCSGQDLSDNGSAANLDVERTLRDEYVPMLMAIVDCPLPVISAVNGPAAGAGANLALVADVVIATESAYFLQAFTRIGLIPDAGGTWALPRQMGLAKAMGAALFAEKITAREADKLGLIWEAVPDDAFEAKIAARAGQLANGPTVAYKHIKTAMRASFENNLDEQLTLEAKLQGECGKTRDFMEGVMAFLQKRPAKYEGR